MSDTSKGPDWWQASNGKWYAPELHPDYLPPVTPEPEPPAPAPPSQPDSPGIRPGWWQASDGNWYPPERHPDYRPPSILDSPTSEYPPIEPTAPTAQSPTAQSPTAQGPTSPAAPPAWTPAPPAAPGQPTYPPAQPTQPAPGYPPMPGAAQPPFPPQTYPTQPGQPPAPYGMPPAAPYVGGAPAIGQNTWLSTVAMVCGVLSFCICAPVFGTAGIIMGSIAMKNGEPRGKPALIVSVIGLVLGLVVFVYFLSSSGNQFG